MGFGGGAMIAKVSIDRLLAKFYKAPEYLGSLESVQLVTEGGRRFVDIAGNLTEVVIVTANDIAKMIVPGDTGVYIVGTGSSGAAQTFLFLGIVYFLIMTIAHFLTEFRQRGGNRRDGHPQKTLRKQGL